MIRLSANRVDKLRCSCQVRSGNFKWAIKCRTGFVPFCFICRAPNMVKERMRNGQCAFWNVFKPSGLLGSILYLGPKSSSLHFN